MERLIPYLLAGIGSFVGERRSSSRLAGGRDVVVLDGRTA